MKVPLVYIISSIAQKSVNIIAHRSKRPSSLFSNVIFENVNSTQNKVSVWMIQGFDDLIGQRFCMNLEKLFSFTYLMLIFLIYQYKCIVCLLNGFLEIFSVVAFI